MGSDSRSGGAALRNAQLKGQIYTKPDLGPGQAPAGHVFCDDRSSSGTSSSKSPTAITQYKKVKLSGSQTSRRSASDTARGPASGFSSLGAVVEQRHI